MKHVRIEEGQYSFDTGDMPNWMHEKKPHVGITNNDTRDSVIVPIRLVREFLASYNKRQREDDP